MCFRLEQKTVLNVYIFMVAMFAISTMLSFWLKMHIESAIISTILMAFGAYGWYFYWERVRIRFYFRQDHETFNNASSRHEYDASEPGVDIEKGSKVGLQTGSSKSNFSGKSDVSGKQQPMELNPLRFAGNKGVVLEGFLTKLGATGSWARRYFTLTGEGFVFYYKTKKEYVMDKGAIKVRPIKLREYSISLPAMDELTGAMGGAPASFQITLTPKDASEVQRKWVFRADSAEEIQPWVDAFREFI